MSADVCLMGKGQGRQKICRTKSEAKMVIKFSERTRGVKLAKYKCQYCETWHVTHMTLQEYQTKKKKWLQGGSQNADSAVSR